MSCLGRTRHTVVDKLKILKSTPFLFYLDEADLELLASCFTVQHVRRNQTVPESPFYLLLRGELAVVSKKDNITLCTKQNGAFFSRRAGMVEV